MTTTSYAAANAKIHGHGYMLDERDAALLAARAEAHAELKGPRVGDFIRFACGTERRVSFVTPEEWLPDVDVVQTSAGGSWYLGLGYCSFSGSLYPGVRRSTLTRTEETKQGRVWFFHHDHHCADNGVDADAAFRVYECSEEAPL